MTMHQLVKYCLGVIALFGGLSWSGILLPERPSQLFTQADARIGRPWTPMSYAGVARRTTRRSIYAGAAIGAATVGAAAVYAAPACVRVIGPAGGVVVRCQ